MTRNLALRAGDWVEVKSKKRILETLDVNGQLDELPFMPEMLPYCGQRFRVSKRAHKTCDPPNGLGARRMTNAVHLEDVRCDGQAHDGCQAGCLMFWKEAWLDRIMDHNVRSSPPEITASQPNTRLQIITDHCSERDLRAKTRHVQEGTHGVEEIYSCQSTRLSYATQPLQWWDVRQYVEDYASGNARLGQILATCVYFLYTEVAEAGLGLGAAMRWAYDRLQQLRGGTPYPFRTGRIPKGAPTPTARLDLKPGERVRVKHYPDILATLNDKWHNRGMYFDPEGVPFCGKTYEVLRRVDRIIDEKSGRMLNLKSDAIILKDVACQARYAKCRKLCPRAIYPYWREIWLERTAP